MSRRLASFAAIMALTIPFGFIGGAAEAAVPTPTVDYRFNDNLKSSVHTQEAPVLKKIGESGDFSFGGGSDKYLEWVEGAGLKITKGAYPIGSTLNYTIAMKVQLDDISDYRKLVDLCNRKIEEGWYEYSGYIYPYEVGAGEPDPLPIQEDTVHTIVLTRAGGNAKGYVDGERYFTVEDPAGDLALGPDPANKVLSFFIDDTASSVEQSGGRVYRLRIWKDPLTNAQAEGL
jgi:hypothetical protein